MYRVEVLDEQARRYRIHKTDSSMQRALISFLLRLPTDVIAVVKLTRRLEDLFKEDDYVECSVPVPGEPIQENRIYLQQFRTRYAIHPNGGIYVPTEETMAEHTFYNLWELSEEEWGNVRRAISENKNARTMTFYYTLTLGEESRTRRLTAERRQYGQEAYFFLRVTESGNAGVIREELELERKRKEMISSLFDDWIYEYDVKENRVITINRNSQYASGSGQETQGGVEFLSLEDLHPEDKEAFSLCCQHAIRDGQSGYTEARVMVDDEYRWMSFVAKVLTDKSGNPLSVVGKISDIDAKKREELRLKEKAMRDAMTGLYNRAAFQEKAEEFLEKIHKESTLTPAVLIIDIDRFKQINDQFGHLYGDTIIMSMANSLQSAFDEDAIIGRFGGDEFVVLLFDFTREMLVERLEFLYDQFRKRIAQDEEGQKISASIGISSYGEDGTDLEELIKNADNALYYIKENGRNGYAFCTEEMKKRFSDEYRIKYREEPIPENTRLAEDITEFALELLEGSKDVKSAVNLILMKIGKRFGLAAVSVREYEKDRPQLSYLWHDEEKIVTGSSKITISTEERREIKERYQENRILEYSTIEMLPKHSALYKIYKDKGIGAVLQSPFISEGKVFGYICYMDAKERDWTEEEKQSLLMLGRVISNYLAREHAYERIEQRVELMKSFDEVTGLLKFDKFKEVAQEILEQGGNVTYGVASVDFAHFKYFNEIYGFRNGDEVLRDFADVVAKHNPRTVAACRDYADNFIIMVVVHDEAAFLNNIATYNASFISNQSKKYSDSKMELCVGAYIITDPKDGIVQAIDNANIARKLLKEKEHSGILKFEPEMKVSRMREIAIQHMMEEAIDNGEFCLYLQSKISLKTGKLVGAEALARWRKPNGTIVSPAEFIPPLEKTGKIVELDFFMYESMLRQMKRWMEAGYPVVPISVNLSRHHFTNQHLAKQLVELAEKYGIDRDYIEIEITESAFIEDQASLIRIMKELKELGFTVSIDDFGTGYSSLSMLTELPADVVKLDQEFLRKRDSETTRDMLNNIIRLIKDNHMTVLCEGVETEEQAEFLSEAGCNVGQGYYFSKPIPIGEFEKKYFAEMF